LSKKKSYEKLLQMALQTELAFYIIINATGKQISQKSRLIL